MDFKKKKSHTFLLKKTIYGGGGGGKKYQIKCVFSFHSFFSSQIFSDSIYLVSYTGDVCRFIEATTKKCLLFVQI